MDLTTSYLGLDLKNPIVPSSSPLSETVDGIRRLEDNGASAVVLHSLFEEQIRLESQQLHHHLEYFTDSWAEGLDFFPDMGQYSITSEQYLEKIRLAKESVDIPIIGSLNGITDDGWTDYALKMQQAGADAVELNVYYIPTTVEMSGAAVEEMYTDIVRTVSSSVTIPVAVKLNPFFSAPAHMAKQLSDAGAKGLVLFNRFYQPDFDIEELEVVPRLTLSTSYEMRLPLRWISLLYGRIETDFAITSGIHTYVDVLKGLMAGAKVTMMASELLLGGSHRIGEILTGMRTWMTEREYESVKQMQGSLSARAVEDPDTLERANYMKVLASWSSDPAGQGFRHKV
ncbi:MAG: dihydroorotate dehydrogenase-like protein [Chloroflexi bacterium]|nr:dihydroorotate dehydrogenase-like protein [Chloroflexota bacterium]